ncbi:hypothetical protein DSECCO2_460120 [anaerobic digester metagenome]
MPQRPDERGRSRFPETGEHISRPLPDQGVVVPERLDQRIEGRLPHRLEYPGCRLPDLGMPENRDERTGCGSPDPDQHAGGRFAEPGLVQGLDQRFHRRFADPDKRLFRRFAERLSAEQADQGGDRRSADADQRLHRPGLHRLIEVAEPCRQEIDGRSTELHDLRPSLQRDQVDDLLLCPPFGSPLEFLEDPCGSHPDRRILAVECPGKRFECRIADPGESGRRSRLPVALLAEEGDEGVYRGRTDPDQGVDGLPVKAVLAGPDEFDDSRNRFGRPEPAQNLDGVLPGGPGPIFEHLENGRHGRFSDGNERIRRHRGDGLVGEGIHERA